MGCGKSVNLSFTQFYFPTEILCDNGPELRSKLDKIYLEAFGLKHTHKCQAYIQLQTLIQNVVIGRLKMHCDQSLIRSQIHRPRRYHGYCMHIVRYLQNHRILVRFNFVSTMLKKSSNSYQGSLDFACGTKIREERCY